MDRIQFTASYEQIISMCNLLEAWKEFIRGKRKRKDVQEFEQHLLHNILALHADLVAETYTHGSYDAFKINDPKSRDIHKASVRDRLLHHALYRQLYPFFDRTFIADSYSCRLEKGTHRAMDTFHRYAYKESKNNTRTLWVLKCDIRKFFASINQAALIQILAERITGERITQLLKNIILSFSSTEKGRGLPLGNLTSQLLVNIYMNEFDQFVKHKLKAKHYIRYADDFVFFSTDRKWLESLLPRISAFLRDRLALELHPGKVSIRTLASGIDFLGWVHFSNRRVLRTTTKKRMFRNIHEKAGEESTVSSYLGLLTHGNTVKLIEQILGGQ
ncbi:MAG: reverse transcriptase/maturase family protein [Minisyncoccia bacterium]